MTAAPIAAVRALSGEVLIELADILHSGRLRQPTVTPFGLRYAVAGLGEAAAVEICSLLASGLAMQHAAMLVAALAAERGDQAQPAHAVEMRNKPVAVVLDLMQPAAARGRLSSGGDERQIDASRSCRPATRSE